MTKPTLPLSRALDQAFRFAQIQDWLSRYEVSLEARIDEVHVGVRRGAFSSAGTIPVTSDGSDDFDYESAALGSPEGFALLRDLIHQVDDAEADDAVMMRYHVVVLALLRGVDPNSMLGPMGLLLMTEEEKDFLAEVLEEAVQPATREVQTAGV